MAHYCNRRNFRTQFNFVFFVLLAESTKFCCIWKPYMYTSICDTALAVRKFIACVRNSTNARVRIFTRTKISSITVFLNGLVEDVDLIELSPPSYIPGLGASLCEVPKWYCLARKWQIKTAQKIILFEANPLVYWKSAIDSRLVISCCWLKWDILFDRKWNCC